MEVYMKKWLLSLFSLSLLLLTGCQHEAKKDDTFQIATTFYPLYYFTKEIVKDKAEVTMVTPNNMEPHDYEPSAKTMSHIEDSALFIYNSPDLETWVPTVKKTLTEDSDVTIVKASENIPLIKGEHGTDPHVWLDPVLAKKEVQTITQAVIHKDPRHREFYEKNSQQLQQQLDRLNHDYQTATAHAKQRTFVTQHAAFTYLAKQYHLKQQAIAGLDPEQEPSPKELSHIEALMKKEHLNVIYVESQASDKVAHTVKQATGAKLLTLNTLESLSKEEQQHGANYFTVMQENLQHLKQSLQ